MGQDGWPRRGMIARTARRRGAGRDDSVRAVVGRYPGFSGRGTPSFSSLRSPALGPLLAVLSGPNRPEGAIFG